VIERGGRWSVIGTGVILSRGRTAKDPSIGARLQVGYGSFGVYAPSG